MEKFCFITLATTPRYLEGAKRLYNSYKKFNSKYSFKCMVIPGIDLTGYEDLPVRIVPEILPSNKRFEYSPGPGIFTKLNLWNLEEYEYVLYLDSDMIFYQNIDAYVDQYIAEPNNEAIMTFMENFQNPHNILSSGWIFLKTNYRILSKALRYLNVCVNEEEIITFMYDTKELPVQHHPELANFNDVAFHFDDWHKGEKYWENELGRKIYDLVLTKPEVLKYIKEIQLLVAWQADEFSRIYYK